MEQGIYYEKEKGFLLAIKIKLSNILKFTRQPGGQSDIVQATDNIH